MSNMIVNPVIPGFNPDPSFCRAGDDYYILTSTFEWFPGVPIYHSSDLAHWRLTGHALGRRSLLALDGIGDSGGVWAPSLSFHDGMFYLLYTVVRHRAAPFKDLTNYLITAPAITGPWSEPVALNASGFDPSLFHDDDGRKWLANIQWDFRKDRPRFAGIVLQEYDAARRSLTGSPKTILQKSELIEGPNLYKRNGWYYLMLAEGGTGWNHGIAMARSRSIDGPYELDPEGSVLTTRSDPEWPLQKAGHGELVQTQSGDWLLAHLCSRPVGPERRCILGRETALQEVVWTDDGWLRLKSGGVLPQLALPAARDLESHPWPQEPAFDGFDGVSLSVHWSALRVPIDETWASLRERPGWLRLRGRESLHSLFSQSLVARRLPSAHCVAETCLEFDPAHFTQMAGLIAWYDTSQHYYLRVTRDEARGKVLGIVLTDDGAYDELLETQVEIDDWPRCYLRAEFQGETLRFSASPDGLGWRAIGPAFDATKLSDDYGKGLRFTGAMVGLCAQDINGMRTPADFDYFELRSAID